MGAERGQGDAVDVDPVQEDRAVLDLVEAGNQRGEGGLARAHRADHAEHRAGGDAELDVLEGRSKIEGSVERTSSMRCIEAAPRCTRAKTQPIRKLGKVSS